MALNYPVGNTKSIWNDEKNGEHGIEKNYCKSKSLFISKKWLTVVRF